jgi:AMMECR1 domain-containing protein
MASIAHCLYCFDVISAELERPRKRSSMAVAQVEEIINKMQKEKIEVENREAHSCLEEHVVEPTSSMTDRPLFVTWKITRADGRKNLRGCIGTFQPLAVEKGLRNYAKIAYVNPNLQKYVSFLTRPLAARSTITDLIPSLQMSFLCWNAV